MRRILFPNVFNHHQCDWQGENTASGRCRKKTNTRKDPACAYFVILLFTGHFDKQSKAPLQTHKSSQMSGYGWLWLSGKCVSKKAEHFEANSNAIVLWNLMSSIRRRKEELCYALLLVKWRKLIRLYSSHKGNCFWVNDCFRQWGRQAKRHKQALSWREICANSQNHPNCKWL